MTVRQMLLRIEARRQQIAHELRLLGREKFFLERESCSFEESQRMAEFVRNWNDAEITQ